MHVITEPTTHPWADDVTFKPARPHQSKWMKVLCDASTESLFLFYTYLVEEEAYRQRAEENRQLLQVGHRNERGLHAQVNELPSPFLNQFISLGRNTIQEAAQAALISGKPIVSVELSQGSHPQLTNLVVAGSGRHDLAAQLVIYLGMTGNPTPDSQLATLEGHGIVAHVLRDLVTEGNPQSIRIIPSAKPADPLGMTSYASQARLLALGLRKSVPTIDIDAQHITSDQQRKIIADTMRTLKPTAPHAPTSVHRGSGEKARTLGTWVVGLSAKLRRTPR